MTKSIFVLFHAYAKAHLSFDETKARTALTDAIETAHTARLLEGAEMPEPVAYIAWRDGKPNYEGEDVICEDAVWPADSDDDRESMGVVTIDQLREYVAGLVLKAVAAEREQCATVAETSGTNKPQYQWWHEACTMIADAIRARGNV